MADEQVDTSTTTADATTTTTTADTTTTAADTSKTTLLTSDDTTATTTAAPADWPTDWREKLAGGDEKTLKQLQRYSAPADIWNKARALEQKVSSGELKANSPFPADGDDKAKTEWRKANGIPDKPEAYEPKVEGLVFGDADKAMLDSFKQHAHGKNWSPAQFNEALGWYAAEQAQIKARQDAADEAFRSEASDKLHGEWGPEYRPNINAIKNMLASAPDGFADNLLGARLADGKLLGDHPEALKWLASLSREINPAATLVPPGTTNAGKSVQDELNEIRRVSREEPHKLTPAMEARQIELIAVLDKINARAA